MKFYRTQFRILQLTKSVVLDTVRKPRPPLSNPSKSIFNARAFDDRVNGFKFRHGSILQYSSSPSGSSVRAYRKRVNRRLREIKLGLTRQSLFFLQDSQLIIYMTSSFGKKTLWFVWSCSIGSLSSRDSSSIDRYFRNISFTDEDDDELVLCTGPDLGNKRTLRGWIEVLGDALSIGLPIWVMLLSGYFLSMLL